jgi:hypothetical protein
LLIRCFVTHLIWLTFRLLNPWTINLEEPLVSRILCFLLGTTDCKSSRLLCYDRRSVGQTVLEWSTHRGLTTRFLLMSNSCGIVDVGRCLSLWREDWSVVYNCCWPSPAQSFSGPSPMVLGTIFYCLKFETSLFVSSYDSQGYNEGIRTASTLDDWLRMNYLSFMIRRGPRTEHMLEQFIYCNLLIRCHGNAWQSPGNALIYTGVFVAAETCFS